MDTLIIKCLSDNYSYFCFDKLTKVGALFDIPELTDEHLALGDKGFLISDLFCTHSHADHIGGLSDFRERFPAAAIHGPTVPRAAFNPTPVTIWSDLSATPIHTPCHTQDSVCWRVSCGVGPDALFTGDTLFRGGVGKFFEGTADQMHASLFTALGGVPDETLVYAGHEYTAALYGWAKRVDPDNKVLQAAADEIKGAGCTMPSTMGLERRTNPFMRVGSEAVKAWTGTVGKDDVATMKKLREMKDSGM